jgi:hypothetical protein
LPLRFPCIATRVAHAVFRAIVRGVLIDLRKRGHGRSKANQTRKSQNKRKRLHCSTPSLIVAATTDNNGQHATADEAHWFANARFVSRLFDEPSKPHQKA